MSHATERTRLLYHPKPQYAFDTSIARQRQRRVKQFQCCLCVIFIFSLVIGFLVAIALSINEGNDPDNSSDALLVLLTNSWPLQDKQSLGVILKNDTEWNNALQKGQLALERKKEIPTREPPLGSPTYKHQKLFSKSKKIQNFTDLGDIQQFARKSFPTGGTNKICRELNSNCTTPLHCNTFQKFRTYNGSCNNLNRSFGVAYTPFRRALPPDYADGLGEPRIASNGGKLPSARTISLEIHRPLYKNDDKFSVMLAVWGQFLDHDMTATVLTSGVNGSSISCCEQEPHPDCFPVILDKTDPDYYFNSTCMEFVRSAPAPTCCLGVRNQMNQASSYIDGSVIYGVDEETVNVLRTKIDGKLEMYTTEDNRTLLPPSKELNDGCNRMSENSKGRYCFLTGDARANENLHLTSIHLLWARQHNLIAGKLKSYNMVWDDERIFQETRKIIGAQMQHISYNEFLPILLGEKLMDTYELSPRSSGHFLKYNNSIDPSIANNFATAAFRFAHSIIPSLMKFLAKDSSSTEFVQLHKMLFDPFRLYQPGELDRALRGAMDTSIQAQDPYFSNELKQHLFESNTDVKKTCGLDLVSLNIQRGRDHGLPGYNAWREHCGLKKVSSFEQLRGDLDDDSLNNMRSVYRNVEDIDLYTGAVSERPIHGGFLGPTITCLLLDQFIRAKYGDRFWYENPKIFTLSQLDEIRKTSMARIICDNADNVQEVQPRVMEKICGNNKVISCNAIPEPLFHFWKDETVEIDLGTDVMKIKTLNNSKGN